MEMKIVCYLFALMSFVFAQEFVTLTTNETNTMYNSTQTDPYNETFVEITSHFNCSLSVLYTYLQSQEQLNKNTQYYVKIYNLSENLSVHPTTTYGIFNPTFNTSVCQAGNQCTIAIQNNCPDPVGYFDYFDRVNVHIQNLAPLTYNVICNSSFTTNTFEWGLLIEIVLCTILITIVAIYSKAWSIGGNGITVTLPLIIGFNIVLIIGGVIAAFSLEAVNVCVEVLSWIFGTIGVGLCFNEIIWLFKLDCLKMGIKLKGFDIRIMEGISLVVGLGVCFGWWFSNKNWIVNDIVAVCMTVASIKVLKFISMRISIICFCITSAVQLVFVILINFVIQRSYNTVILNEFNNPWEIQMPTINAVYNQKCAWLPITAIWYPGAFMSYMRRFDSSRNTNVYLITSVVLFLFGALMWMFVSIISPYSWPFGLIAEPLMISLVSFFAWKRKQIRTLWSGKFYDQEFANKQALNTISQMIERQRKDTRISYEKSMFKGLQLGDEESIYDPPVKEKKPQEL